MAKTSNLRTGVQNKTCAPLSSLSPDGTVKTLNRLARESRKKRLLQDILTDMAVCELEGWSRTEYVQEIREMLAEIMGESF